MKSIALLAIAATLAACSRSESPPTPPAAPPPPAAPAPTSKAFAFKESNDLITLEYSYSAEAAAVPQLVASFGKELATMRQQLTETASADRAFRQKEGYPFNPYSSDTDYKTAGQSASLLSLSRDHSEYTGGAHPNHGTSALLWDRPGAHDLTFKDLFAAPGNRDRLLTQRWCDALNVERAKRRGSPVSGNGMFDQCPSLDEIAIIPTDKNGDGRFDTLTLIASPYVAGPYVEGEYDVELAVTEELIAGLKAAYRPDFEIVPSTQ